ncbi:DUF6283 family protein [Embleya sp. NPDC020630]|uniref:DUF6283 family protein n=1 Tax=Embleya sp. NPDC020630 TaxID=3363979 RepID=UPI0037B8E3ED
MSHSYTHPTPEPDDTGRGVSPTHGPPAPRPCDTCPYRRDVPSGIWAPEQYAKLPPYDAPTPAQPAALWQCHVIDRDAPGARVCAGWVGCHGGDDLLALRLALLDGRIDADTRWAAIEYTSPVPLFGSGAEAAAHGLADIDLPGAAARAAIDKITRTRRPPRTALSREQPDSARA